jgi:squalene cyclase
LGVQVCLYVLLEVRSLTKSFSTAEQGYTVSDCTAEGLKAVLYIQHRLE